MGYSKAIEKGWNDLSKVEKKGMVTVMLLGEKYTADIREKRITLEPGGIQIKEHIAIILLHYLAKRAPGLPEPSGEWIAFNEIAGGEGYYPTFKKRTIDVISRRHGRDPAAFIDGSKRFGGKLSGTSDAGVMIEVLEKVPILITLWKGDEEFAPEANIHFDSFISQIFCAEDVVVLSEVIAHKV